MNRFHESRTTVLDSHTGLIWVKDASLSEFPLTWPEALAFIAALNKAGDLDSDQWRLPNRRELFSLVDHNSINPCLPSGHPFTNVFNGYYWTSTTCVRRPEQAWYIHFGGARVFKGMKHGSYMVWPVRNSQKPAGGHSILWTGQHQCFDESGIATSCLNTGQDAENAYLPPFEGDRFIITTDGIRDQATGLLWMADADILKKTVDWETGHKLISGLNQDNVYGASDWRMPTIVELETLVDLGRHSPALSRSHPFINVRDFYWSSTTSRYEESYAWVLYLIDGAVGVGYKPLAEFHLWPVRVNPGSKS